MLVERKVKLVTEQHILTNKEPVESFPMREWNIKVLIVDDEGNDHPANCFQKVVFNLHPSFENPVQTFTKPPFTCTNEGWGEFEMTIDCYITEKQKQSIAHDLHFGSESYDAIHPVTFKNPSQALQQLLRESGPLPSDEKKKTGTSKKPSQKYDLEKIADALEKLEEDDLLRVIQIIQEHKTPETYIKSDVDAGEFSIDLFTMSDGLTKALWDHLSKKGLVS